MSRADLQHVQPARTRPVPVLTAVAVTVAVAAAVVQYTVPGAVAALQRDPQALAQGQWWRLVTPLLVQTLGWYQVAANLGTLAVAGAVTEWLLGRRWWLLLAAGGTAAGQLAAYLWHEPGGGDSIAICGLAGGVVAALLTSRARPPAWAARPIVVVIAALTGWGLRGIPGAAVATLVAVIGLYGLRRVVVLDRFALGVAVVCAVLLTAVRDLHGVTLAAGMAVAAGVPAIRRALH